MNEVGLEPKFISCTGQESSYAVEAMLEYLRNHEPPDGLHCQNDELAIGANQAARNMGIRVPTDMRIIGSDGISETAFHNPSISTIAIPVEEMCRLAWEFLLKRMVELDSPLQQTVLPMKLIVRESTAG